MPYYLHMKETEPESGTAYPTASDARQFHDPATQKITFVPDAIDRELWRQRERDRMNSVYFETPWVEVDNYPDHYAHLSIVDKGLVAYTKNEEHGMKDRQTRVKPGKYLEEFYSHTALSVRADWIGMCGASAVSLSIARTAADIVKVYIGGPSSCMDGDHYYGRNGHSKAFDCGDIHPCSVYGDSDVGVAYAGDMTAATARAIVWPDKMRYGRRYGNTHLLEALLDKAGYSSGSMRGAKIRALPYDNGYIVPYVDGIDSASVDGKWLILDNSGDIPCQHTNGVSEETEESEPTSNCSNCGETYPEEDDSAPYCQSCYDDSYTCEDCGSTFFSDGTSTHNGTLCELCANERMKTCAVCDRCWIEEAEFSRRQIQVRDSNGVSDLCVNCEDDHAYCSECDVWYENDNSECPDCKPADEDDPTETYVAPKLAPRCEHTADLLAEVPPAGVRYIKLATGLFADGTYYLMLDLDLVLWAIDNDGTFSRITKDWHSEFKQFVDSGAWVYFNPDNPAVPPAANTVAPMVAS